MKQYELPPAYALDYWVVKRLGVQPEQWANHCGRRVSSVDTRVELAERFLQLAEPNE